MPLLRKTVILPGSQIGIWRITETAAELKDQLSLDPEEETTYSSFGSENRRKQWLACRLLVKELLGKQTAIRYKESGKPSLEEVPGHLSLTHSGGMAAVLLSRDFLVGVDIERMKDRIEKVKERFLSASELEQVGTEHRVEKLHVLWGAKECLYKIAGRPDTDFRIDLRVEPFDYLCNKKGACRASLDFHGSIREVKVVYETIEEYMLVCAFMQTL